MACHHRIFGKRFAYNVIIIIYILYFRKSILCSVRIFYFITLTNISSLNSQENLLIKLSTDISFICMLF